MTVDIIYLHLQRQTMNRTINNHSQSNETTHDEDKVFSIGLRCLQLLQLLVDDRSLLLAGLFDLPGNLHLLVDILDDFVGRLALHTVSGIPTLLQAVDLDLNLLLLDGPQRDVNSLLDKRLLQGCIWIFLYPHINAVLNYMPMLLNK